MNDESKLALYHAEELSVIKSDILHGEIDNSTLFRALDLIDYIKNEIKNGYIREG